MDPLKKKKKKFSSQAIDQAKSQTDQYTPTYLPQIHPAIPPAFALAVQHGAPTQALTIAKKYLGEKEFQNLCEGFVETVGAVKGRFSSAIDAWKQQQDKAQPGVQGLQQGDAIYFSPNQGNGQHGHVGIYSGNGNFVSATPSGIKELPVGQWVKNTGQQILGYVRK